MANLLLGEVSGKAAKRWGKPSILNKTRVNRPNEEEFHGKQGLGDQGGADWNKPLDGGDRSVAGTGHIDTKQGGTVGRKVSRPGSHSSRPPQKFLRGTRDTGGNAGKERQPTRRDHIDSGSLQMPKYKGSGWSVNKDAPPTVRAPANSLSSWRGKGVKKTKGMGKKISGGLRQPSNKNQYGDPQSRRYG